MILLLLSPHCTRAKSFARNCEILFAIMMHAYNFSPENVRISQGNIAHEIVKHLRQSKSKDRRIVKTVFYTMFNDQVCRLSIILHTALLDMCFLSHRKMNISWNKGK